MFGKQLAAKKQKLESIVSNTMPQGLQLHAIGGETSMLVPDSMIQPLRHMTTQLSRQSALPSKVAVVAALRQEGVSSLSIALGALLAHDTGQTVCVVDLNWWWPSSLFQTLGRQSDGLIGVVQGNARWSSSLIRTNLPNLTILPAGLLPLEERPIVARSATLKTIITEMTGVIDHLILDIPAILSTSDAVPLASLSDACCLVAYQGLTTSGTVKRAIKEIDHLPMLGLLLNRTRVATPQWIRQWLA
mgnify:CR=1 FL=1